MGEKEDLLEKKIIGANEEKKEPIDILKTNISSDKSTSDASSLNSTPGASLEAGN